MATTPMTTPVLRVVSRLDAVTVWSNWGWKTATMAMRRTAMVAPMAAGCPAAAMGSFRKARPAMMATNSMTTLVFRPVLKPVVAMAFCAQA